MQKPVKLFLLLSVIFLSDIAFSQPLLGGSTNSGFIASMDGFFAASISNPQDFAVLVIAPLVAIYALFKYIITVGLGHVEDNLESNDITTGRGSDQDLSNTAGTAARLMSLTLSFVIVTYYGGSIMFIGLLSAVGALLWFASTFGTGFSLLGGDEDGNGGEAEIPDELQNQLNEVQEELGQIENLEERIGNLEEEVGGGSDSDDDDEIPNAVEQRIEAVLSLFESGEDDLMDIVDTTEMEVQQLKQTFNSNWKDKVKDQRNLNSLLSSIESEVRDWAGSNPNRGFSDDLNTTNGFPNRNFSTLGAVVGVPTIYNHLEYVMDQVDPSGPLDRQKVETEIGDLLNDVQGDLGSQINFIDDSDSEGGKEMRDSDSIEDVLNYAKKFHSYSVFLGRLETSDELESYEKEAAEMLRILESLGKIFAQMSNDLDVIMSEEQYMMEMVQRANQKDLLDEDLRSSLRSDASKAQELKSNLQQLKGRYRQILAEFENLFDKMKNFLDLNQTEIQEMLDSSGPTSGLRRIVIFYEIISLICNHDIYKNYSGSGEKDKLDEILRLLKDSLTSLENAEGRAGSGHASSRIQNLESSINNIKNNL